MATAAEAARDFLNGLVVVETARQFLNQFPIRTLCEALITAQPTDVEVLLSTLERLVEFEEVCTAFLSDDVLAFLREGAAAPDARARRLVARLLVRLVQQGEESVVKLINAELVQASAKLLLDEETGTAEASAKVLCNIMQWSAGKHMILGGSSTDGGLVTQLQASLTNLDDVKRFRVLHLFVELGRTSDEAFGALESLGAYKDVLSAFLTDDILLKLNAVELMDALGSFQAGQVFLSKQGVPEQLAKELIDPMCDSSVRICVTRLLGFVLLRAPETMDKLLPNKEAPFAQSIAEFLNSRDPVEKLIALNAWANCSMHPGGISFFCNWPEVLQTILSLTAVTEQEVSKGAMAAWAGVLQNCPLPNSTGDGASDVRVMLWDCAEKRLLPSVLKVLASKPFPDVRCHTWQLLAQLVRSQVAAQHILPSEEIRELLLDFSSETSSDARIAKHEFVQALVHHHEGWLGTYLDDKVEGLLVKYAKQGPHWVPHESSVIVGDQAGG